MGRDSNAQQCYEKQRSVTLDGNWEDKEKDCHNTNERSEIKNVINNIVHNNLVLSEIFKNKECISRNIYQEV